MERTALFNVPPAIVTGYIQRVFGMGFGYGPVRQGANQRLLLGRSMISFSSSGAPEEWLRTEGGWTALKNLFDEHVAEVCGLTVLDQHVLGVQPVSLGAWAAVIALAGTVLVVGEAFKALRARPMMRALPALPAPG